MYGKLTAIIKEGKETTFILTDLRGAEPEVLPSFHEWMVNKIGHKFNVFVTDKRYFITDEEAI